MKKKRKAVAVVLCVGILLVFGDVVANRLLYRRATPPSSVTDLSSCIAWLGKPMGVIRVTTEGQQYIMIQGPSGRLASSGTAAYTFDASGRFIGWTPDMGDVYSPSVVFSNGASRETISVADLPITQ